jgi:hypothetical protein
VTLEPPIYPVSSPATPGEGRVPATRDRMAALHEALLQLFQKRGIRVQPAPRKTRHCHLKRDVVVGIDKGGRIVVGLLLADLTLPRVERAIVTVMGWRFKPSEGPRRLADVLYVLIVDAWPVGLQVERRGARPKVIVVRVGNIPTKKLRKPLKPFHHELRIVVHSIDEGALAGVPPAQVQPQEADQGAVP